MDLLSVLMDICGITDVHNRGSPTMQAPSYAADPQNEPLYAIP